MDFQKLYHGTYSKVADIIRHHGFILGELMYHNFLSPHGVYLVLNRPLLARRFAKIAARSDMSNPAVLEVKLKPRASLCVLDLTTDKGMNRLYQAYVKVKSLFGVRKRSRLARKAPKEYVEYLESVMKTHRRTLALLDQASRASEQDPKHFNWDTVALGLAVEEDGIHVILAAIQEGTSFNLAYAGKQPKYTSVPSFGGVRLRDHLEVCVTDLSLIDLQSIAERAAANDVEEYEEDFVHWITNIDAPDVEE